MNIVSAKPKNQNLADIIDISADFLKAETSCHLPAAPDLISPPPLFTLSLISSRGRYLLRVAPDLLSTASPHPLLPIAPPPCCSPHILVLPTSSCLEPHLLPTVDWPTSSLFPPHSHTPWPPPHSPTSSLLSSYPHPPSLDTSLYLNSWWATSCCWRWWCWRWWREEDDGGDVDTNEGGE